MRRALALLFVALALPALAQDGTTAEGAARAARRLREAAQLLDAAEGSRDRLAALTQTVRAYEDGLGLMRDTLRRVAEDKARLQADLDARRAEIAGLLAALQSMGETPEPVLMLHPSGALDTARAGMLLADVAPALQARAEGLRAELETLSAIEQTQAEAEQTLRDGLLSVQTARADLAAAAADRTDLPRAFTEDPVATALLMASTETLDAFAAGLGQTVDQRLATPPDTATARAGTLPLPVEGTILRRPGEPDPAGVARPGLVLSAEPRALVTMPVTATLRFRGPLLDYGTVAILEPAPGTLFVLAGLAQVFGDAGEILPEGTPLGMMGGETPDADAMLTGQVPVGGSARTESLYLEVRNADGPVDPGTWFRLD
ncbi:murein hydrolase activator EnvC family protein [Rubellimicrobium aerolatum]|uniref:Murein hydrolase activator EnvC family protein n=1 Tax=Rubellimicrobium aerolatum TaxID=490979 RepID=A0ABW0SFI8_9RHOB|nr:peptidase M23 [Rubellimicrobium aerolatum]MBP1807223.1 septal ring factor EnvC (AmiA/AmiB activator) [Rubellimicrobium aerolatum]